MHDLWSTFRTGGWLPVPASANVTPAKWTHGNPVALCFYTALLGTLYVCGCDSVYYVDTHPHFKECVARQPRRLLLGVFCSFSTQPLYGVVPLECVCLCPFGTCIYTLKTHSACFWLTNEVSKRSTASTTIERDFLLCLQRGEAGNIKYVLCHVRYKVAKIELLILWEYRNGLLKGVYTSSSWLLTFSTLYSFTKFLFSLKE